MGAIGRKEKLGINVEEERADLLFRDQDDVEKGLHARSSSGHPIFDLDCRIDKVRDFWESESGRNGPCLKIAVGLLGSGRKIDISTHRPPVRYPKLENIGGKKQVGIPDILPIESIRRLVRKKQGLPCSNADLPLLRSLIGIKDEVPKGIGERFRGSQEDRVKEERDD